MRSPTYVFLSFALHDFLKFYIYMERCKEKTGENQSQDIVTVKDRAQFEYDVETTHLMMFSQLLPPVCFFYFVLLPYSSD